MTTDRLFKAPLVIDPKDALLEQGYIWTMSRLVDLEKDVPATLSWEVGSGAVSNIGMQIVTNEEVHGEGFFVNSFTGGQVLPFFNRNLLFAATAKPPATVFRFGIDVQDATLGNVTTLFVPGINLPFPSFILPGPLHGSIELTAVRDAKLHVLSIWHEQPDQDKPAGDLPRIEVDVPKPQKRSARIHVR